MLGGLSYTRDVNMDDRFEKDLYELFSDVVKASDQKASQLWGSLANVDWHHEDGEEVGYSFRAAGDLVAAIRGEGGYMDWYCSERSGYVWGWVEEPMLERGWIAEELEWNGY